MLSALIDNNSTWLVDLSKEIKINYDDEKNVLRKNYIGWIVNNKNTIKYIQQFPIEQFYFIDRQAKQIFLISKEDALFFYHSIKEIMDKKKKRV